MKQLFIISMILLNTIAHAQVVTPSVIASTGSNYNSGGLQVSYTIGELAVTWANSGTTGITQGFHQPGELGPLSVKQIQNPQLVNVSLYPNPADNILWLNCNVQTSGIETIELYNIAGIKIIDWKQEMKTSGTLQHSFNVSNLASGVYLVQNIFQTNNGNTYSNNQQIIISH